jgi:AraC-like DNA-binding protein
LIAQEAGFTDQSHLTSIFRRETGITPGRFRAELI